MEPAAAAGSAEKPAVAPLTRSNPDVDPWVEKDIPAPQPKSEAQPKPVEEQAAAPQPKPESEPQAKPEPELPELRPEPKPEPVPEPLPAGDSGWQRPTEGELEATSEPRYYDLPDGAIMGLTVPGMGIYDAPVFDSTGQWALTNGVAHVPESSLPWSRTPERNVYLAGHRMGYSGTWSRMIFYHLDKLGEGDEVLLEDREGGRYEYRVIESFVVDPDDSWVMGRVRGRDMLTLQTCTPSPGFDKRLIVRAERI
jgi:sortase A